MNYNPNIEDHIAELKTKIARLVQMETKLYNQLVSDLKMHGDPDEPFLHDYVFNLTQYPTFKKYLKAYGRL